ncbi:facilitated trehalose transporter Tret1-like isoform X2 [Armigeres subalbatus]|uniref:facilitated trehalose transporter Tret1-like isoform X2 n=1 Tax=Armigeres subalbatus TaxID=124917 RepID=UPI002ED515B9
MTLDNGAKNQYLATFLLNCLAISYGSSSGWMSPSILILMSENSPLKSGPITADEGAWIGAILCVGGLVGSTASGWMADRYGRKRTAYVAVIPQIVSWIMVMVADNVYYLYAMRLLSGFGGGVCYTIIPMFIGEISEDRNRGMLGATFIVSINIGQLFMYILGAWVPYTVAPYVLILIPVIFFIGFTMLPDTPLHYMKKNNYQSSEESLKFYRGYPAGEQYVSAEIQRDLHKLRDNCRSDKQTTQKHKITWSDLSTHHARKAFLIGVTLVALNNLSGCFAMLSYAESIFRESGSSLSADISAIITGSLQVVGSYCSTVMVERVGRKILLKISGIGMAIGLGTFSGYLFVKALGYDVDSFKWLPLVCFSFVIFIASVGVLPLPFLILAELVPQKFISTLFDVIGMHGTMLLFAIFSACGTLFVTAIIPETKGKSYDAIAKLMV